MQALRRKRTDFIRRTTDRQTDRPVEKRPDRRTATKAMSHSSLVRGFITEMKFVFICLEPRSF